MSAAAFSVCIVALYLGGLFALSRAGQRRIRFLETSSARSVIYILGCCINWGLAPCLATTGVSGIGSETLLVWLGAPVFFAIAPNIIRKIIVVTRARGVTTVADFASAAYGKTLAVGAIVATCFFAASIPLNAVFLNGICLSFSTLLGELRPPNLPGLTQNFCIFISCAMAVFTIATGTRRPAARSQHDGISLVVAAEIIMRLVALAILSTYVVWRIFGGVGGVVTAVMNDKQAYDLVTSWPHSTAVTLSLIGFSGLLFMPSQFQMTVMENRDLRDTRRLAWAYPLLTFAMIIMSLPFLAEGMLIGPQSNVHLIQVYDVPVHAQNGLISAAALIAGFGAITSLMLVSTTTVASIVSNDLVLPALLHTSIRRFFSRDENVAARVFTIRRIAIAVSYALSCWCSISLSTPALDAATKVTLGLFTQAIAPCIFAIVIKNPPARCAIQSMAAGLAVWVYIMVLPLAAPLAGPIGQALLEGPFKIAWLSPAGFSGLHLGTFADGIFCSVGANIIVFLATWAWHGRSRLKPGNPAMPGSPLSQIPAQDAFFRPGGKVTLDALRNTVGHYIVKQHAIAAFDGYLESRGLVFDPLREADAADLTFGENLLATAVGKATAHLVVTLFLRRQTISPPPAFASGPIKLPRTGRLNEAGVLSETILTPKHGMILFDPDLRLVAWNVTELEKEDSKADFLELGLSVREVVERAAKAGFYGTQGDGVAIEERYHALLDTSRIKRNVLMSGRIFECRSLRLPDGFLSLHYIDITDDVRAEESLEAENEILERRVRERTQQLQRLNEDLIKAKADAEEANISKTRFIAAASHDLLQPLNAARLYATSLRERIHARTPADETLSLALNVEDSLEAVEDILTALLDISHLDAGATKPETTIFPVNDIFRQVQLEFEPTSREKGLRVTFVASSLPIISDKRLLRRVLRNFVSNAIKYTLEGRVLVGVRRFGAQARIEVWDTGIGIPKSKQRSIFREFERLPDAMLTAPGAGLGLSIVKRLGLLLNHEIEVHSRPGLGSVFAVIVPRAGNIAPAQLYISPASHVRQGTLDGLEVAVIDNETTILQGMSVLLGGWGCNVTSGESLDMLLVALDQGNITPDVIIADYRLTHEDGISAIETLRSRYGHIHAILITADRSRQLHDIVQSKDIRFLNKPVKPAVLRSLLSRWRLVKQAAE